MSSGFQSLKGQFILDGGNLAGSFFARTVVLICQHDEDGAFGLVLNRDTGNKVQEALTDNLPEHLQELEVFLGGPVQPTALTYLYTEPGLLMANVMPNVNFGHSLEDLIELGNAYSPTRQVKVFAGYSGWSSGQLENEMAMKSWITHPASVELIFDTPPRELWKTILREKGWKHRLIAEGPEDLNWN